LHNGSVLWAFGALAGTALLIGICAIVPVISPLATGLPGLLLIAVTVLYGLNVHQVVRFIPLRGDAFGAGFEAMLFNGILLALGLVMVVPLFIPSRWYSRYYAEPYDGAEEAPPTRQSSLLSSDWAETGPIRQNPPSDIWG
jgi:hypothetical protein